MRLAVLEAGVAVVVRNVGAELIRCICLSVGKGWILELRFPGDNFVVQCVDEGSSPTNDCGLSPPSVMGGGGAIAKSCFVSSSVRRGMLCLELKALPCSSGGGGGGSAGSAVKGEEFQPVTGESWVGSGILGEANLVCSVKSMFVGGGGA